MVMGSGRILAALAIGGTHRRGRATPRAEVHVIVWNLGPCSEPVLFETVDTMRLAFGMPWG